MEATDNTGREAEAGTVTKSKKERPLVFWTGLILFAGGFGIFFHSPIVLLLWVLTVISILVPLLLKMQRQRGLSK